MDFLFSLYFPVLAAHLALVAVLIPVFSREISRPFSRLGWKVLSLLALITLLGLYLRAGMSGRYGLDGLLWEHIGAAEDIHRLLGFSGPGQHPEGHSVLVAVSFLFGHAPENAARLTIALDSLSVPLVFAVSFLLFGAAEIALFSSLAFAIIPWQVFLSGLGLNISSSLFFSLAALSVLLVSRELRSPKLLSLSLLLLLWSAQIRVENLALLPLFFFVYKVTEYRRGFPGKYLLPLSAFSVPVLAWLLYAPVRFGPNFSADGAGRGSFMALGNLLPNYRDHIIPHFLSDRNCYPFFLLPMLGMGIAYLAVFCKDRKPACWMFIWFLCWSAVYGFFWCGSEIYRYSVFIHPLLAVVSGCGNYLTLRIVTGGRGELPRLAAAAGLSAFMLFSSFPARSLLSPSPLKPWPSFRELSAAGMKLENGACVLAQRLKYGRFDNFKRLIPGTDKVIEWPASRDLFSYGCASVYYYDLRVYAHPVRADMDEYDRNQEFLFKEYALAEAFREGLLAVYKVTEKR